ncbi:hypothetical protein H6P81_009435 [Aristolochia fimbriata]|uniref:Uncharacterized protein n=1 Tax=Aristolochia fimbriata TaxID=158543 RepID=A0AAV7EMX7_ARIFI|nr:hypothetical protein H6P81_009435 [Aristolochia fimbriata]
MQGDDNNQAKIHKISSRCSPSGFQELLASLNLSEDVKRLFEKTPFGHFLRIPNHKIEVNLLNELLSRFNIESVSFDIEGSHLKFEDKEVTMILGLRLHGLPIDLQSRGRSTFLDSFLKGKPLKRSLLTQLLKSISQE